MPLSEVMLKKIKFWITMTGIVLLATTATHARVLTLAWDLNADPQVVGYRLYCGTSSGEYTMMMDAGQQATATMTGLKANKTYYFAVTAYDVENNESSFSEEVVYQCDSGSEKDLEIILRMLEDD